MKRRGFLVLLVVILISIFLSTLIGQIAEADPGVTKDEVVIGAPSIFTGPAAQDGPETKRTVDLFVEQINSAGGIHGRKLRVIYEDDAYDATRAVAAVRKLIGVDKVFCILGPSGSPGALAIKSIIQEEGVPTLVMMSRYDKLVDPHTQYMFQGNITSYGESEILCNYIQNTYKPKTVGLFLTKGDYAAAFIRTIKPNLDTKGITLAITETAPLGSTDLSAQLLRIKAEKPDLLILSLFGRDAGLAFRQVRELGLTQRIVGPAVLNIVGVAASAGEAIDGVEFVDSMAGSPDLPKGKFKEFMDAYHAKYPNTPTRDMGTVSFDLYAGISCIAEAMRRAGNDLTREKLVAALESFRDYDPGTTVPMTFTSTDHRGRKYDNVFRYDRAGRRLFVAGPFKTTTEPPMTPAK